MLGIHNVEGPLGFSVANVLLPTDDRVINATQEVSGYPFNLDYNTGDTIGIGGPIDLSRPFLLTYLRQAGSNVRYATNCKKSIGKHSSSRSSEAHERVLLGHI